MAPLFRHNEKFIDINDFLDMQIPTLPLDEEEEYEEESDGCF